MTEFSAERAPDARALVEVSHTADQGFLFFVLPIILDRIFFRLAPWFFQTTSLRLMQLPGWRYSAVQRKKRIDRCVQAVIISSLLGAVLFCLSKLVAWLYRTALAMAA